MDEKLKKTLDKVLALAKQNPEFGEELKKMFGSTSSSNVSLNDRLSGDINIIRKALEIRAANSINYDFVGDQCTRDQLVIDNLRMENAALNLQLEEFRRFYYFCVNAFYQVENILNYYFYVKYPQIEDLLREIERATASEKNVKTGTSFSFHPNGEEKNVGSIAIAHKINAACNVLFPEDKIKLTLSSLRNVRNEGEHRCMVIQKDKTHQLYNFFKYQTFNSIRDTLSRLANAIKESTANIEVSGEITSIMPSVCFVKYNGKTESLPLNLFQKVRTANTGDSVILVLTQGKIADVKLSIADN